MMKTKSTPCVRNAHDRCSGCYCDCHPINFDEFIDNVFEEMANHGNWNDLDLEYYCESIKAAHRKSFRHDTFDSTR